MMYKLEEAAERQEEDFKDVEKTEVEQWPRLLLVAIGVRNTQLLLYPTSTVVNTQVT